MKIWEDKVLLNISSYLLQSLVHHNPLYIHWNQPVRVFCILRRERVLILSKELKVFASHSTLVRWFLGQLLGHRQRLCSEARHNFWHWLSTGPRVVLRSYNIRVTRPCTANCTLSRSNEGQGIGLNRLSPRFFVPTLMQYPLPILPSTLPNLSFSAHVFSHSIGNGSRAHIRCEKSRAAQIRNRICWRFGSRVVDKSKPTRCGWRCHRTTMGKDESEGVPGGTDEEQTRILHSGGTIGGARRT